MTKFFKLTTLSVLMFFSLSLKAQAQTITAQEAVNKSFNLYLGTSSFSKMKMTIVRPSWERSIEIQNWSLGMDYYISYVTAPARDRGMVFLKYNKEMWNYVPAINRMIKIPPSMMMQSWMGSDFTNNDLMKQNSIIVDYTHRFATHEEFEGYDCYVINLQPLPEAAVVWGAIKIWIAKDNWNMLKSEYYDTHGKLIKTEITSNLKKIGGRLLATHMEMISNTKKGNKTVIEILYQEFDVKAINQSFFSIQNLKNIKPIK